MPRQNGEDYRPTPSTCLAANDFIVGIMALVAQQGREAIFRSTKEPLAAAKARGVKLGEPQRRRRRLTGREGRRGAPEDCQSQLRDSRRSAGAGHRRPLGGRPNLVAPPRYRT